MSTLAFSMQETSMNGRKIKLKLNKPMDTTTMNNEDESNAHKNMIHVNVVKTTNNINMFKKSEKQVYDGSILIEEPMTASTFKNVKKSCATKKKGLRIREVGEDFPSDCIYGREYVKVVEFTTKFLLRWEVKKGMRSRRSRPRDVVNLYKANNVQNSRGGCLGSRVADFVNEDVQRAAETLMLLATGDYKAISKTSMTKRKVEDWEVDEDMLVEVAEGLVLLSRGDSSDVVESSLRVEDGMITSGGGCKMIHDFDLNEEPPMECD